MMCILKNHCNIIIFVKNIDSISMFYSIFFFNFQSYFCDSYLISRKLQEKIKENFFNSQLKYKALEEEILQSPHWPPVSSTADLVEVFQRMDSAVSADIDRTSLMSSLADSASETGSLRIKNIESGATLDTQGSMATLDTQISTVDDEAQLIETGVDNPGFVEDSHSTTTTNL